jgi:TorA maturation chaperone TorD
MNPKLQTSEKADAMTNNQIQSGFDEETARAELYGLLALFYYAPPATDLIAKLQIAVTQAPDGGAFLEEPWQAFVSVARAMNASEIADEYDQLFGGVGKPEVYLYASHYLSGFLNEKPLAKLRTDLAGLGLARDDAMPETEDHFAYLCEVMRYLIAGEDVEVANLTRQSEFFALHVLPWASRMCDSIQSHPKARFYAALATLTSAFVAVEAQGFDMLV